MKHEDGQLCLPEEEVKRHLEHGDEIINPSGCSDTKEGR